MAQPTRPALTALRVEYVDLARQRTQLETRLLNPQPMRAGTLSRLFMQCGKEGCICKAKHNPQKHGPYDYWRKPVEGKQKLIYLKESDGELKDQLRHYQAFQRLLAQYRKTAKAVDTVFAAIRKEYLIP